MYFGQEAYYFDNVNIAPTHWEFLKNGLFQQHHSSIKFPGWNF